MTGRERILDHLAGQPVDRLPLMPITMMFACDQIGGRYRDYCTDYRVMVEGQVRTAEKFGFDYVNTMSDPAREAADCGARVEYFDQQPVALVENDALLADKTKPEMAPSVRRGPMRIACHISCPNRPQKRTSKASTSPVFNTVWMTVRS